MGFEMFGWVLLTAMLASIFNLCGAIFVYRVFLAKRIDRELTRLGDEHEAQLRQGLEAAALEMMPEFRRELVAGFEEAINEALPTFRAEVEQGVEAGARTLLPEFREEVTQGFRDAMAGVASIDFVDKTAQNMARKSGKIFESGLNALFGNKRRKE